MHHHFHANSGQMEAAETEGRLIRWASSYDFLVNILTFGQVRKLRKMTIELANLKTGEAILDVGCGTGGVTIPASQRVGTAGNAAGIDPSPEMIAVARRKAEQNGLAVDFRIGVIETLPFPDRYFDVVTASLMMHHLPENLQGWPFDGDDLVGLLKDAGFREVTQPEERFSAVGFVRAIK